MREFFASNLKFDSGFGSLYGKKKIYATIPSYSFVSIFIWLYLICRVVQEIESDSFEQRLVSSVVFRR